MDLISFLYPFLFLVSSPIGLVRRVATLATFPAGVSRHAIFASPLTSSVFPFLLSSFLLVLLVSLFGLPLVGAAVPSACRFPVRPYCAAVVVACSRLFSYPLLPFIVPVFPGSIKDIALVSACVPLAVSFNGLHRFIQFSKNLFRYIKYIIITIWCQHYN